MARSILPAALVMLTAACATQFAGHGNHLEPGTFDEHVLASDVTRQLVALYPPAKVRLALQQPATDAFGAALTGSLRESGYALHELPASAPGPRAEAAAGVLPVRYVLDRASPDSPIRLSVSVGDKSLARPYVTREGRTMAAGYWVRKE